MTSEPSGPSRSSWIIVPAAITLAITLLRLVGELLNWSPTYFSKAAGGGLAVIGIVWLVPILGAYFAWRLATAGFAPKAGPVIGWAVLAIAVLVLSIYLAVGVARVGQQPQFVVFIVASLVAAGVAWRGWPNLGRLLATYGLWARVPVVLVMLLAILGNWGTHYDVAPPDFPPTAPLAKWFMIGVVPQILLWVPFTIYVGMLFGGLALIFAPRREPAGA